MTSTSIGIDVHVEVDDWKLMKMNMLLYRQNLRVAQKIGDANICLI